MKEDRVDLRRLPAPRLMLLILPVGFLAFACESSQDRPSESPAPEAQAVAPGMDQLRNAEYRGFENISGAVKLSDGHWEGEPIAPGAASRPTVDFVMDVVRAGDLNADGSPEAAVLLLARSGGTGSFYHLAVVGFRNEEVTNLATRLVGDRVQLRDIRIEDGRLLLDVVQAGDEDPACCPGELATRAFEFHEDSLDEVDSGVPNGRLSIATISGPEWILSSWTFDEEAPSEPRITLKAADEQATGQAGCNRFTATLTPGDMAGYFSIGPVAATRMACPPPEMAAEERFLKQLQAVSSFGFLGGRLALTYTIDDITNVMLFVRSQP